MVTRKKNKECFVLLSNYSKGFKTYIFKKSDGFIYRTKDEYMKIGLKIEKPDMVFLNESDYWNEIEYRSMKRFIDAFGNLGLYGYEYSTQERMEIYAPEMFI